VDVAGHIATYYRSSAVRARIAEYGLGTAGLGAYGGRHGWSEADGAPVAAAAGQSQALFTEGADVCRSLADRGGALVQLDIDYTNPADAAEPYLRPEGVFVRLEPVYREVRRAFAAYDLEPLCLLTGRGYHFTVRAPRDTPLYADLVAVGEPGEALQRRYGERAAAGDVDALSRGFAHDGAGRLLEHLGHGVLRRLRGRTDLPLALADVPPPGRGPFVCLDLSAYADPLFARFCRCAFSANQKAAALGARSEDAFTIVLPRREGEELDGLLRARRDPVAAARLASEQYTCIPAAAAAPGWRRAYERGPLGRFHRDFARGPRVPRETWPYTYDRLEPSSFPACVRLALEQPNPRLLVPLYLRTLALAFWGLGWHPRSVAGLVASRYRQDRGWGDLWTRYEPCARAEFYVRLFCGLAACGLDEADSFSCASQAARGGCPGTGCGFDLGALFAAAATGFGGAA
jgi:hypothetical protein